MDVATESSKAMSMQSSKAIIKVHQHAISAPKAFMDVATESSNAISMQSACNQHAISAPKAFMDVATEPHARLEEARREHIAKEAAARAVAVVALIEHPSRRHLMKEAITMKETILMKEAILMK